MNYQIALGSNVPKDHMSPVDTVSHAIWHLGGAGLVVSAQSKYYLAPALPEGSGPSYVNAVVTVRSRLDPTDMQERLRVIEAALGRDRASDTGARVLDLQILARDDTILPDELVVRRWMQTQPDRDTGPAPDELVLPHPWMHRRAHVLVPLAEVAPDWRHPILGKSAQEMLAAIPPDVLAAIEPVEKIEQQRDVAE